MSQCTSCGDEYAGDLIDVGINAGGIDSLYCPGCCAYDIMIELTLMEKALDADDKEAHRCCALEMLERLEYELKRGDK